MRFVAIELPGQMRAELARIQSALKQLSCGGRFVPARNMHLTLHFIGETSDLHGAVSAVQKSVRGIRPFELHLGRYNCFQKGGSRTSIVEVKGGLSELNALYESLQYAMSDNGFPRERKGYVPHITLGRNVSHDDLVEAEVVEVEGSQLLIVLSAQLPVHSDNDSIKHTQYRHFQAPPHYSSTPIISNGTAKEKPFQALSPSGWKTYPFPQTFFK